MIVEWGVVLVDGGAEMTMGGRLSHLDSTLWRAAAMIRYYIHKAKMS